jgi:hypothetical protein
MLPIAQGYFECLLETDSQERYENDTSLGIRVLDPAYMNTAAIVSKITYIDGLKGVLRHRGYAIEELAEKSDFLETAYLLVHHLIVSTILKVDLRRAPHEGTRCSFPKGDYVTYIYRR